MHKKIDDLVTRDIEACNTKKTKKQKTQNSDDSYRPSTYRNPPHLFGHGTSYVIDLNAFGHENFSLFSGIELWETCLAIKFWNFQEFGKHQKAVFTFFIPNYTQRPKTTLIYTHGQTQLQFSTNHFSL